MSDESTVYFSRKLVRQFIQKYQQLECLWNKHSPSYKAKQKRHDAITQLTMLVQKYDPAATRVHVLRKIDSLRACVRRELRKVSDSRAVAQCEDEIYVPQLWYYNLFAFLVDLDDDDNNVKKIEFTAPVPSPEQNYTSSGEEDAPEEDSDAEPASDDIKSEPPEIESVDYETHPSVSREGPVRKKKRCTEPSAIGDEYDAIGINVAAKLRNIPEPMRILAEKLIGDVLFQAQTNGLTSASALVTPDPFR